MAAIQTTNSNSNHAPLPETELTISGMTCGNCARHVAEAIQGVPEVASASVQLEAARATVRWRASPNVPAVVEAVREAGYEAKPAKEGSLADTDGKSWSPLVGWRFNVVGGSWPARCPLMLGEWVFPLGDGALVSLAGVCAGIAGASLLRGAILSRRLAPAQSGRFQHGHTGRAGFDHRFRLQRLGAVLGGARPPLFYGIRRHHHIDQPRALGRSARQREGRKLPACAAESGSLHGTPTRSGRLGNAGARAGLADQ